jgi:hypothetical protein
VRHAFAESFVVLPATNIRVTGGSFNESTRAVLLIIYPVAIVRIAVLEGV